MLRLLCVSEPKAIAVSIARQLLFQRPFQLGSFAASREKIAGWSHSAFGSKRTPYSR